MNPQKDNYTGNVAQKKHLGQNFLTDKEIVKKIANFTSLSPSDHIIEVGPGEGVLTEELAQTGAHIYAIEYDHDLLTDLKTRFDDYPNVEIIHGDIRTLHISQFCKERNIDSYAVIANVPYYITSMIIRLFLESDLQPRTMTLMIQKEVAERICAEAGNLSKLAVSVQYYGTPEILFHVSREAFFPVPEVDSAVIFVDEISRSHSHEEEKSFFRTVRAGFSAKRKKLVSNLSNSLHIEREHVLNLLIKTGISENARAQEITLEQWIALNRALTQIPTTK